MKLQRGLFDRARVILVSLKFCFVLGCQSASTTPPVIQCQSVLQRLALSSSCLYGSFNEVLHPQVSRVFSDQPELYSQFQTQYLNNQEEALKQWLLSTSKFAHLRGSPGDLQIVKLNPQLALANFGVFRVSVLSQSDSDAESEFILKVGNNENELFNLWKIQNSLIGHPESLSVQFSDPLLAGVSSQVVESLPRFPALHSFATFESVPSERNPSGILFVFLMSLAKGTVLSQINELSDDTLTAYRLVGKSLGAFHYLNARDFSLPFEQWETLTHGDTHSGNIFVDLSHERVTFIDVDRVTIGHQFKHDIFMAGFPPMRAVLLGRYQQMIRRLEIAHRASIPPISSNFGIGQALQDDHDLIGFLNDRSSITQVRSTQEDLILSHFAERILAMRDGYIEAIPEEHRSDVRAYFSSLCKESTDDLMRNFSFIASVFRQQDAILDDLRNGFRSLFPEALNRCIDGT